jgi:hypothetical protein
VTVPHTADRLAAPPDDQTIGATVTALGEHGFSVEAVAGPGAARDTVLNLSRGASVMTNTSVTLDKAARERIYHHALKVEDAGAQGAYGQHSYVGKVLEIHQELPGCIHIVLVRQPVGF